MLDRLTSTTFAALVVLVACRSDPPPPSQPLVIVEQLAVPGAKGTTGASSGRGAGIAARAQDPRFQLKPEEGTLTIDRIDSNERESTMRITLVPNRGFKVATDYQIKLALEPTSGVTLAKSLLTAGGRNKRQGDAHMLTEQQLAFDVTATTAAAGAYEIKGVLDFGVCEQESCHPRTQPIAITVAAN